VKKKDKSDIREARKRMATGQSAFAGVLIQAGKGSNFEKKTRGKGGNPMWGKQGNKHRGGGLM